MSHQGEGSPYHGNRLPFRSTGYPRGYDGDFRGSQQTPALRAAQTYCQAAGTVLVESETKLRNAEDEDEAARAHLYSLLAPLRELQAERQAAKDGQWEEWKRKKQEADRREHSRHNATRRQRRERKPDFNAQIEQWHQACEIAFQDKTSLWIFPAPPAESCNNVACKNETRCLAACKCNIQKAFASSTSLKTNRLRFHPDTFSKVADRYRNAIQQAAKEVFVVVERMHQDQSLKNHTGFPNKSVRILKEAGEDEEDRMW
ncbi:hypothetical protein LTR56_005003 [Elasticomyces elasticus]|nr:hypothetical protein LTR22_015817 [Elasticomyces elasticus]KAK3652709.1 hypothetical protein LTR56_005003 [Elasticomyces elasticus]KAK4914639.1 hypothetical protein LTR49_017206 [Elasticomyces elasticus]KAK5754005.1 hypothetical protein LTS12_015971 [Elasticomyces elasticus]